MVINDTEAPVADITNLPNISEECEVTTLTPPTATDTCVGSVDGVHNATLPITSNITITWTYDDDNGNTATQTQNVIVADTTNPVTPTIATVTGECSATATVPTTTDNCAGTLTGTTTDALTYNTQGTHVITWTFDDGNGNSIDVNQNVVVDDTTNPVADETTLPIVNSECEVTSLTAPTATDNCVGIITGTHNATLPITANTTITWTFDDNNGNTATQTQNVVITSIDNTVGQDEYTLTANATGYAYQWLDCDDGVLPIAGETDQSYTAITNGSYAVEISNGTCSVVSDCITITGIGILENEFGANLTVYPIPTKDYLAIELGATYDTITVKIINLLGQVIQEGTFKATNKIEIQLGLSSGEYLLNVTTKKGKKAVVRIIIK